MNRPKNPFNFYKHRFLILFGPSCLFVSIFLLLFRTSFLTSHPLWLSTLAISVILSCYVIYLSFLEFLSLEKQILEDQKLHEEEIAKYKSLLNDTNLLFTEKVSKMEVSLSALEYEHKKQIDEHEQETQEWDEKYTLLVDQMEKEKNHTSDMQVALDDALDELRQARQKQFFKEEKQKEIPKDLVNQHRQLRQQFKEKSLVLEQTRRRLFALEGQLHVMKQESEEEGLLSNGDKEVLLQELSEIYEENIHLGKEVQLLEEIISFLLNQSVSKKSNKQIEQILEFQFDNV